MEQIIVPARYNGPPDSANGGYTCGLIARATGLAHPEVTLRRPPPLDVPLRVDGTEVYDGEHLVAQATEATGGDLEPPAYPGLAAARTAQEQYAGLRKHPFPTCYVCGPDRDDGLGLYPGPIGDGYVATTWTPADVTPETVWAALDCPGAWALLQSDDTPIVLGRLAVRTYALPRAGQSHVITGWQAAPNEGRKRFAGTALHDTEGKLLATGQATWIAL